MHHLIQNINHITQICSYYPGLDSIMFSLLTSLRAQTEADAEVVHQLKEHQTELEADVEEKEKQLVSLEEERQAAEWQLEEVKRRSQSCNSCRSE